MEYKFCTDYKTEDYILKTSWEDLPKGCRSGQLYAESI